MKLVINNCYGGFGLSPKGIKRYLELKGKEVYCYVQRRYLFRDNEIICERIDNIENVDTLFFYCTTYDQGETILGFPKDVFHSSDIKRNDPTLIQVVEELEDEASGKCSDLIVVEIENGRWYKIDEYDGYESIQYRDIDDEWELAEDNE